MGYRLEAWFTALAATANLQDFQIQGTAMPLQTTTFGACPKPDCTPVRDWFLAHLDEDERKASAGLLTGDVYTAEKGVPQGQASDGAPVHPLVPC